MFAFQPECPGEYLYSSCHGLDIPLLCLPSQRRRASQNVSAPQLCQPEAPGCPRGREPAQAAPENRIGKGYRGVHRRRPPAEDLFSILLCLTNDHGHPLFDDTCLLTGNSCQRVSQELHMIMTYICYH